MTTTYRNDGGVARVTVNRNAPAPRSAATAAAPARARARVQAVQPRPVDLHAVAANLAQDSKARAMKAAYFKGKAVVQDALRAALALGWKHPVAVEQAKSATGLPLTIHFNGGHKAIVHGLNFTLVPAAK
jgi:hypothetical protein